MAGQSLTFEQLSESIAQDVGARLGLSSFDPKNIVNVLGDIKYLLTKIIDVNGSVQSANKFPTILTNSFKDLATKLESSSENALVNVKEQEPAKVENTTTLKAEELPNNKTLDSLGFVDKQIKAFKDVFKSVQIKKDPADFKQDILEQIEEPKPMLFAGFTPDGLKSIQENLPEIIEKGTERLIGVIGDSKTLAKSKETNGFDFPGMGIVKGALGVLSIVGGIFTLLYGLQTEGPFKGLAKLAGKGMLEIGKILTAPLKEFIVNISDSLLKTPLEMIKTFSKTIGTVFKNVGELAIELTLKAGRSIASPITNLVKSLADNLLSVPLKLFNSFKNSIIDLFGKVGETSIIKTGLGKLTNFIPTMLKGLVPILKKIPIVGTLISLSYAVSRFKSGDYVGGGIDILSGIATIVPGAGTAISIGLDALNAFLDIKSGGATGKQQGTKIDLLKGIGDWIGEKIVKLPIIGPLVKGAQYLAAREWKKGLKQLAFAFPAFDVVAAFLGDKEASDTAKSFAGTFQGINWQEIGSWLFETFKNVPIIGPLMKAMDNFKSGEFLKGLKQLAYINPIFEAIGGLFEDTETGTVSAAIGDWGVDLVTDLSKWIVDSLSEMIDLDAIKDKISGAASGAWETIKGFNPFASEETPEKATSESLKETTPSAKLVGDAKIKPDGGLLVSSPTEGSLFQLSKNDGIVAAPFESPDNNIRQTQSNSFAKAETILEKIANNTGFTNQSLSNLINGFNNLAKALKESGTIKEAPLVINQADQQQSKFAGVAQYAAAMSSPARNYNLSFAEAMKPIRI